MCDVRTAGICRIDGRMPTRIHFPLATEQFLELGFSTEEAAALAESEAELA